MGEQSEKESSNNEHASSWGDVKVLLIMIGFRYYLKIRIQKEVSL